MTNRHPVPVFILATVMLTIIGVTYLALTEKWWPTSLFWDLDVYKQAVNDQLNGTDPYRKVNLFTFVYHPVVLHFITAIGRYIPLSVILTTFYAASAFWFFYELRASLKTGLKALEYSDVYFLLVPVLTATTVIYSGITAFFSGNITTYMHFFLIALFLRNIRRKGEFTSLGIMAVIGLFAVIKPYFLAYILVVLLGKLSLGKKALLMSVPIGIFITLWGAGSLLYPDETRKFLYNISTFQKASSLDIGMSFYFFTYLAGIPKIPGLLVHGAIIAALLVRVYRKSVRMQDNPYAKFVVFAKVFFILTLANPRMKEYDLYPALALLFSFLLVAYSQTYKYLMASAVFWLLPVPVVMLLLRFTDIGQG